MKRTKLILTPVKELPKREKTKCDMHDLDGTLEEFIFMDSEIAKVEFGSTDYAHLNSAATAFTDVISKHKYSMRVCRRNGGLYLIKKDI